MFKRVLLSVLVLLTGFSASYGQTILIGPNVNNGGFEDATNTAWQIVNGTEPNKWQISTGATAGFSGTKCAYISQSTSAPYAHTYNISGASTVHMYQDIIFPAAEPVVTLSFKRIGYGEDGWDKLAVYISNAAPGTAPVANTPAPGYIASNTPAFTGYTALAGYALTTSWTTATITIPAAQIGNTTASSTRRILFLWTNDGSVGTQPPAGIDDVLLTSSCSPSPAPTGNSFAVCQGAATGPITVGGTNLLFYTSATGGVGNTTIPTPSTANPGDTTFYVTQNTNGCETIPRKAIVVTVKPTPPAPTLINGGLASICQFSPPLTLTATGVPGATFTYYTTATGNTTIPPPTLNYDPNVAVKYFYVSQTLNGCEGPRAMYTVGSYPKPAPPIVSTPLNLCQFAIAAPLTAGGTNIKWYENPSGGVSLLTDPVPSTNFPDTLTYFASQTVNGCESDRSLLEVIINYQPNATFIPSKRFVCVNDTISFVYYGNATPDATYNWFIPTRGATEVSGQGTQGPFVAQFDSVGVFDVRLIVVNKGCASTPVFQRIEVRDRPVVRINAKREICLDEVVEITVDSMSDLISNYDFTFDNGTVEYATYNAGPFGVSWNTPGIKNIIVNSTSRFCGSRLQAETIFVRPAPAAAIQNKPTGDICASDSVRLQADDLGPSYEYTWTPSNIFQDRGNRGTTVFTTPLFRTGKYAALLTVTDSVGCIGKDSVVLTTIPCCDVFFPNAFTPNGDDRNDRFGMMSQGVPSRFTLRVVNRWGRVMFETSDARIGWDGRYNGEEQPTGTYFFYSKYQCANGQDYEQKGEITLIR